MTRNRRRAQAGVSLQEILLTMALVGILAAVAIPNFTAMMRASRAKTAVNAIVGAAHLARQRSVTRQRVHVLEVGGALGNHWRVKDQASGEIVLEGDIRSDVSVTAAADFTFTITGGCSTPTTYSGGSPAGQYLQFETIVQGDSKYRYTVEITSIGKVNSRVEYL